MVAETIESNGPGPAGHRQGAYMLSRENVCAGVVEGESG